MSFCVMKVYRDFSKAKLAIPSKYNMKYTIVLAECLVSVEINMVAVNRDILCGYRGSFL